MNKSALKPIFILSLPRSGSTLLQRILMSSKGICSYSEPHLMLPLVYMLKKEGTLSEYGHYTANKGISDIVEKISKEEFYSRINEFATKLYSEISENDCTYFIDKSPSYFWILNELHKIFPEGKFIYLFRNPCQIYASMLNTFANGNFNRRFCGSYVVLQEGFPRLVNGYLENENGFGINYEDLVANPLKVTKELCEYLEISFNPNLVTNISKVDKGGSMGDPTGTKKYQAVSTDSLENWKTTFQSVLRKRIVKSYINSIDDKYFAVLKQSKKEMISDINSIPTKGRMGLFDYLRYQAVKQVVRFNLNILLSKSLQWKLKTYVS